MLQRLKETYRRQWPRRPVADPMSRNFRVKDRNPRLLILVLLILLLVSSVMKVL